MKTQHLANLERANEIRITRANTIKQIQSTADAVRVIQDSDDGLLVRSVLRAIPRWGSVRVERALEDCALNYWATLGGERKGVTKPVTDSQRQALVEYLEGGPR